MDIQNLVNEFAEKLEAQIRSEVTATITHALTGLSNGNGTVKRGPGRPPKLTSAPVVLSLPPVSQPTVKTRKKAPKQLCPVPRCKNLAAPIFGMTCAKHKDVAKSKIKKYREARRQAKAK